MRKNSKAEQSEAKAPKPMDPTIRENAQGTPAINNARTCWAVQTLVTEFLGLFPETPVEYTDVNGRNTAIGVVFDLTALPENDRTDALLLFRLLQDVAYNTDPRIDIALIDTDEASAAVRMYNNPRTYDSRDAFGLADALDVLAGDDDPGWGSLSDFAGFFEEGSR